MRLPCASTEIIVQLCMANPTDRTDDTEDRIHCDRKDRHDDFDSITERALAVFGRSLVAFDYQLHGLAAARRHEHFARP